LAGGHSIDTPEPIFGLAVTGEVSVAQVKKNNTAKAGAKLYLTKPIGIGIMTTAQKKKHLKPEHKYIARDLMCQMNKVGAELAKIEGVCALTDVTGFGLLGHLLEMCQGSDLSASIDMENLPLIPEAEYYRELGCIPGGTDRNFQSYGMHVNSLSDHQKHYLCDPQTSGGLLIAVEPNAIKIVEDLLRENHLNVQSIGQLKAKETALFVEIKSKV